MNEPESTFTARNHFQGYLRFGERVVMKRKVRRRWRSHQETTWIRAVFVGDYEHDGQPHYLFRDVLVDGDRGRVQHAWIGYPAAEFRHHSKGPFRRTAQAIYDGSVIVNDDEDLIHDRRGDFDATHALVARRINIAGRRTYNEALVDAENTDLSRSFVLKPVISEVDPERIGAEHLYAIVQWGVFVADKCAGTVTVDDDGRMEFKVLSVFSSYGRLYDPAEPGAHPVWSLLHGPLSDDPQRANGIRPSAVQTRRDAEGSLHIYAPETATEDPVAIVTAFQSLIDGALCIEIGTAVATGRVRINVNDGAVFDADPETGKPGLR